jgi:HEAT repeat protein
MTNDIDEPRDWRGCEICCETCTHHNLLSRGQCAPKKACVQDRYARRIDRFFEWNASLANDYLAHPHFEVRAVAATYASVFLLPPLLNDPDETVRWEAAQRLPQRYILALRADPHREVRIRVASCLNGVDLHPMMEDPDYYVRLMVARRVAPSLLPLMIHDCEPEVRRVVVRRIGAEWLVRMASDEDGDVRLEAAQRMSPDQLPALRNDPDWRVRYHVASRVGARDLAEMLDDPDPLVAELARARAFAPGIARPAEVGSPSETA